MRGVCVSADRRCAQLDICTTCEFVWFDASEMEQLPEPPAPPAPEQLPEKARELLAMERLRIDSERHWATDADEAQPTEDWKWIPGIFGMPVEIDAEPLRHVPWLSISLTVVLIGVYLAFLPLGGPDEAFRRFGLIPAAAFRDGGITFLTAFFIHAGWLHLASNAYFLFVFGRHVEDYLGVSRYALLILAATLAGGLAHVALDPRQQLPSGGASGGISGIIMFYALAFPRARIGLLILYYWVGRWFYVSAVGAMGIWIVLQLLGAWYQVQGMSMVSNVAHLGGAFAGLATWLAWRYSQRTELGLADDAANPSSRADRSEPINLNKTYGAK